MTGPLLCGSSGQTLTTLRMSLEHTLGTLQDPGISHRCLQVGLHVLKGIVLGFGWGEAQPRVLQTNRVLASSGVCLSPAMELRFTPTSADRMCHPYIIVVYLGSVL